MPAYVPALPIAARGGAVSAADDCRCSKSMRRWTAAARACMVAQSGDCASRTGPSAPRDRPAIERGRSRVVLTGTFTIVRALD
jgi:hypothetical protein